MPVAVLNVRPTRQKTLNRVRMDNRNKTVTLSYFCNHRGNRGIFTAGSDASHYLLKLQHNGHLPTQTVTQRP